MKGPTWLSTVPSFDVISGCSIDYMHCVLLDVCRLLLRMWFQSQYHSELWYIGHKEGISSVDERLCGLKPPNDMQRTPRSVADTVKFWKGE